MKTPLILSTILLAAAAHAAPRTSTDYAITTDIVDSAGQRTLPQ